MKKEYLILILIILVLGGYLVFKKEDRSYYTLPTPPAADSQKIDRLVVKKPDLTLMFTRIQDGWVVTDQAYPADDNIIRQMLDVVSGLTLSALVSEKQDLSRYQLDADHCLEVTAYRKETQSISFKIGKTAPTYNHTFVMLENNPLIYHAKNSFRSYFDQSLNEFRDKEVLTFTEESVKGISIQAREKKVRLTALDNQADSEKSASGAFRYEDGASPDPKTVSNLTSTLSALTCDYYLETRDKADLEKKGPGLKIILETTSALVLNLFDQGEDEPVLGTSSMNPYAFALKPYVAEDITTYAHELVGLTDKDTEGEGDSQTR